MPPHVPLMVYFYWMEQFAAICGFRYIIPLKCFVRIRVFLRWSIDTFTMNVSNFSTTVELKWQHKDYALFGFYLRLSNRPCWSTTYCRRQRWVDGTLGFPLELWKKHMNTEKCYWQKSDGPTTTLLLLTTTWANRKHTAPFHWVLRLHAQQKHHSLSHPLWGGHRFTSSCLAFSSHLRRSVNFFSKFWFSLLNNTPFSLSPVLVFWNNFCLV